jgi:undecaprenyl-diphosphatase
VAIEPSANQASSTAINAWRAARDGFLDDWRSLPSSTRRHYLRMLGLGLVAVLILTAIVSLVTKAALAGEEAGAEAWFVSRVADWRYPSLHMSIWLEEPGGSVFLTPFLLLALWTAARLRRSREAIAIAAGFLGAKAILLVGRLLFPRDRPDLIGDGLLSPTSHSFPSGHTIQAFAAWGVLAFLWLRASRSPLERAVVVAAWLAIGLMVAAARMRMGTHWPSDLIAGALLGVAWAGAVAFALHRSRRRA